MRPYNEESAPPALTPIPAGAGFGIRLAARVIDLAYGFVLSLAVGIFTGVLFAVLQSMGLMGEEWLEVLGAESNTDFLVGILAIILYHTCSEGIGSASLGKLILGLRVVQEDGRPCTFVGALKRDLAYMVDSLFFGLVGYSSMKKSPLQQRYGDKWGKTVVVKKTVFTPEPKVSTLRILTGLFVGSLAWMAVTLADVLLKVF